MKLGIFYSHPRTEEKALFAAAEEDEEIELMKIRDNELELDLHEDSQLLKCDVVLLRSISHTKNFYLAKFLEARGIQAVNDFKTITTCGDKFLTSIHLAEKKVPTPKTKVCFDTDAALQTIEKWGYPVVMKPVVGSWGRLLSKIDNREAAETILEHKKVLGGITHSQIFYIQEFIDKKSGSDIRAVVIGDEVVAAMQRKSEHWITNTARGADVENFEITPKFEKLVKAAAKAVSEKPALLGVDLIETKEGLKVVEVNSGVEFHGLLKASKVDIPGKIIEFCKNVAE
ncbi:lysine biosynthesis protein LysX [Candidatus Gracilibacteria bacterium]|nr:lysine biosynthesis protein LysX [Candidatus Gracilibacteria bacterium]